jgi:hypothetical protein
MVLAMQLHAQVITPCDCVTNALSLWYYHFKVVVTGINFDDTGVG